MTKAKRVAFHEHERARTRGSGCALARSCPLDVGRVLNVAVFG